MADSGQSQINWLSLIGKLTVVALNLFRKRGFLLDDESEPVLKGLGKSPMDFAKDAIVEFHAHRDRFVARDEGEAFAVMVTILQRDFIDATRSHSYKKSVDTAEKDLPEVIAPDKTSPDFAIRAEELANRFKRYANGKPDLIEVIEAAAILAVEQRRPPKPSDVAALLGIDEREMKRRSTRLKYQFHADDGRSSNG